MGIITILSISVALTLLFIKYKKHKQTQSDNVLLNNDPVEERSNAAYDEIGEVEEVIPMYENEGEIRRNQELRRNQVVNQKVLVSNDNPNASNSDQSFETQSSNYERPVLSQVEKRAFPHKPLQVHVHTEGGTSGNIPAFSTKTYENIDSKEQPKDVDLAMLSNDEANIAQWVL